MAELGRRGPNFKLLEKKFCKQLLSYASVKKSSILKKDETLKVAEKETKKFDTLYLST